MYEISKFFVRPANAKFNNYGHNFELSLRKDSNVILSLDESANELAGTQYSFTELIVVSETNNDEIIGKCTYRRTGESPLIAACKLFIFYAF